MNSDRRLACRFRSNLATTLLSTATVLSLTGTAFGQEPASADSPASAAQPDKVKEATTRFERGLALYDDSDFDAALVEFNRAYSLSPTYKILYNIGKIERVKNDYSSALAHFQRYLAEGGSEVPAERREEVEKEVGVLKERVAELSIKANVDGAAVYIDDIPVCGARMVDPNCVGTTPLRAPVLVNPGTRKVTAIKRGYQNAQAQLTLAGGDKNIVKLDLFDLSVKAEDTGPRTRAIVAWTTTGALAIGAGVVGVLTLGKKSDYDKDRDKAECANQIVASDACNKDTFATLDSDKKTTKTFALVTDILAGAAVVGVGISIYLTAKASGKTETEQHATLHDVKLSAGAGSAFLSGAF
jgi:tetratricopeptide (TPR) repeat protein